MQSSFSKSFLVVCSILMSVCGLVTMAAIVIPTNIGNHEVTMIEIFIGSTGGQVGPEIPIIKLNADNDDESVLILADGLTIGASTNDNKGRGSTIGAGRRNVIFPWAMGSVIGAGDGNHITAPFAAIGAGWWNLASATWSFIGAGENNKTEWDYSIIVGGQSGTVAGAYSIVVGGGNHSVAGDYSLAAGQATNIAHSGVFAWSDYDDLEYRSTQNKQYLESQKANTFLVRSRNGMGINTGSAATGVNVAINWGVYFGGLNKLIEQGTPATSCSGKNLAGTIEAKDGCYYFCDGTFRQVMNLSFPGDNMGARCGTSNGAENAAVEICNLEGIKLRAGDQMRAFSKGKDPTCPSFEKVVMCDFDGKLKPVDGSTPAGKYYVNCLPCDAGYC